MSCLLHRLRSVPGERSAVWGTAPLKFSDLGLLPPEIAKSARGRGVILQCSRVATALTSLVGLDGVASDLLLASREMPCADLVDLGKAAGCTLLLTDSELRSKTRSAFECISISDGFKEKEENFGAKSASCGLATSWLLTTSGTTGKPKLVRHSLASLTRTTKTDSQRGASARWGLVYDYTRFAGLQVLLQSLLSGSTLIVPDLSVPFDLQVADLARGMCTHLSATPTLWRKLLMTESAHRLELQQVTLGGEIADQRILDALRHQYPNARIAHIYASTEAGVGFSVVDGREGFPASFLEQPPAGIDLRVRDGRLYVRNRGSQSKYLNTGEQFADASGYVRTGDLVEIQGDRCLFLGREHGVINIGGNKVHPEQVERVILQHPQVRHIRVYSRRNPITGALVAADVVVDDSQGDLLETRASILSLCRAKLDRHQVPASLRFVEDLKSNVSGKLAREAS